MRGLLVVLVLVVLALCGGCASAGAADRLRFDAIAPRYVEYVLHDPMLDPQERERVLDTPRAWEFSLRKSGQEPKYTVPAAVPVEGE